MNKQLLIFIFVSFNLCNLLAQNFESCKIDFSILEQQESFDKQDIGKEFILINNNIPSFKPIDAPNKSVIELKSELNEKLNDNIEYNKNNLLVRDSLISYYSNLIDKKGITLLWWEEIGIASSNELIEFKNSIKEIDKGVTGEFDEKGRWKHKIVKNYNSAIFITPEEYNMYVVYLQIENSGKSLNEKTLGQIPNGYKVYQDFETFELSLDRYYKLKSFPEIILIKNGIKYKLHISNTPTNTPIFAIQDKDSNKVFNASNNVYAFQIGIKPEFDLLQYSNSKIILKNVQEEQWPNTPSLLEYIIDDKLKLSVINFKFVNQNDKSIDRSVEIFFDKKKLILINSLLTSLKSESLVIQSGDNVIIKPKITDVSFDFKSIKLSFTFEDKPYHKEFEIYTNIDESSTPDISNKQSINIPIYYYDCYDKKLQDFNNLTLVADYKNDPTLKKQLYNALVSSPEWLNFSIQKVIITNKSQWVIVTNNYTGLKESRFIFADIYAKSTKTNKCYLKKEVYFTQKLDPLNEYIYPIIVSVPQDMEIYPCNLK